MTNEKISQAAKVREQRKKERESELVKEVGDLRNENEQLRLDIECLRVAQSSHVSMVFDLTKAKSIRDDQIKDAASLQQSTEEKLQRCAASARRYRNMLIAAVVTMVVSTAYFTTGPWKAKADPVEARPKPGEVVLLYTDHPPHLGYMDSSGTFRDFEKGTVISRVINWKKP